MKNNRVLLVDDDIEICKLVKLAVKNENIDLISVVSGKEAHKLLKKESFDLIILDIMLNDTDGFQILQKIKVQEIDIPVIFLSGQQQDYNQVLALGMGAEDYITKPFNTAVLVAQIKAALRRGARIKELQTSKKQISRGEFVLNLDSHQFFYQGKEIFLSAKEIMIVKLFMENPNKVISKDDIYNYVWKDESIDNNTIAVYIKQIRNKMERCSDAATHLTTVWGLGYKFLI